VKHSFLDHYSDRNSFVHRLDPRSKVIATVLFLFTVISFPKYEVVALAPFFLFPVLLLTVGEIPILFIVKKMLIVSPFAIFIGIFNPFLDTRTAVVIAGIPVSAGLLSFLSILLKFSLTISAALLLIATTSFPGVCHALRRLGFPALFVSQLLFLYRYLFVLMEEAMRIIRHAHILFSIIARGKLVHSLFDGTHTGCAKTITTTGVFHRNIIIKSYPKKLLSFLRLHTLYLAVRKNKCNDRHCVEGTETSAYEASPMIR